MKKNLKKKKYYNKRNKRKGNKISLPKLQISIHKRYNKIIKMSYKLKRTQENKDFFKNVMTMIFIKLETT